MLEMLAELTGNMCKTKAIIKPLNLSIFSFC
jgi:hypothetical protein